jgi:hypothetical protein
MKTKIAEIIALVVMVITTLLFAVGAAVIGMLLYKVAKLAGWAFLILAGAVFGIWCVVLLSVGVKNDAEQ